MGNLQNDEETGKHAYICECVCVSVCLMVSIESLNSNYEIKQKNPYIPSSC